MLYKISVEFTTNKPFLFQALRDFLKSQKVNMKMKIELAGEDKNESNI
jgi:hypothetical protein